MAIYALLAAHFVLDALILLFARNLYITLRLVWQIAPQRAVYIDGGLFIGAVLAVFIHLVASERTYVDKDFARPILTAAGRAGAIQLLIIAVLQGGMIAAVPPLISAVWPVVIAAGSLAGGLGLIVLSSRFKRL